MSTSVLNPSPAVPTWVYLVGGGALLLLIVSISGGGKSRKADADDLESIGDVDPIEAELENISIEDFANSLNSLDGFQDLVSTTTSLFDSSEDRVAEFTLVSGLLDGLSIEKISILADVYCSVMDTWIPSFATVTSQFMTTNESLYRSYSSDLSNFNQCKKSAVYFDTTETNTSIEGASKGGFLGGVLWGKKKSSSTEIKQFTKTPVPICSQMGIDERAALSLLSSMNVAVKSNYLVWATSLKQMPTMLSAIGL